MSGINRFGAADEHRVHHGEPLSPRRHKHRPATLGEPDQIGMIDPITLPVGDMDVEWGERCGVKQLLNRFGMHNDRRLAPQDAPDNKSLEITRTPAHIPRPYVDLEFRPPLAP